MKKRSGRAVSVARRMAGKKGAAIQLQQEVTTEEEWEVLLQRPGLIVVDVYSGWCGPCLGMVGNLKKIKLEIGGDMLILAIAKADDIEALQRFRNKSEPTWLFISNGKLLHVMFGANGPRLMKLITEELQKEADAQEGLIEREGTPLDQLAPEEQERAEAQKRKEEAILAIKELVQRKKLLEKHLKLIKQLTEHLLHSTVVVFMPFTFDEENGIWSACNELLEALGPGFKIKQREEIAIDSEMAKKVFKIVDVEILEEMKEPLEQANCLVLLLGTPDPAIPEDVMEGEEADEPDEFIQSLVAEEDSPDAEEEVEEEINVLNTVFLAIYGTEPETFDELEMDPECLAARIALESGVPGVWTPANAVDKAEAVIALLPAFTEQYTEPEPEPLPPHVIVVFDAIKYSELFEALEECENDIMQTAFFDGPDAETSQKIASTYDEFRTLPEKTGTEKLVIMLNHTKSDTLLTLSQFMPTYISQNVEEGEIDGKKWFKPEKVSEVFEIEQEVDTGKSTVELLDIMSLGSVSAASSYGSYDPLALRESKIIKEEDHDSVISGLEFYDKETAQDETKTTLSEMKDITKDVKQLQKEVPPVVHQVEDIETAVEEVDVPTEDSVEAPQAVVTEKAADKPQQVEDIEAAVEEVDVPIEDSVEAPQAVVIEKAADKPQQVEDIEAAVEEVDVPIEDSVEDPQAVVVEKAADEPQQVENIEAAVEEVEVPTESSVESPVAIEKPANEPQVKEKLEPEDKVEEMKESEVKEEKSKEQRENNGSTSDKKEDKAEKEKEELKEKEEKIDQKEKEEEKEEEKEKSSDVVKDLFGF